MPELSPCRPGLPWLGRVGPRASIRDLAQPWTFHPVLDPCPAEAPPPLPFWETVGGRLGGRGLLVWKKPNKCWGFAAINGGCYILHAVIRGFSRAFAGVLGARCPPLRNGGIKGRTDAPMRSAAALPCPAVWGGPRCPDRTRSRCHHVLPEPLSGGLSTKTGKGS